MKIRPGCDPPTGRALVVMLLVVVAVVAGVVVVLTPDPPAPEPGPALWEVLELIVLGDGTLLIITADGSIWRFDDEWERQGEFNGDRKVVPQVPESRPDVDRLRSLASREG